MTLLEEAVVRQFREAAKQVRCRCCGAEVGEPCVSRTTRLRLVKQPACRLRLQDAGVFPRGGSDG